MNRYELDEAQVAYHQRDPVPPHQDWSPLEQWIWFRLQAGEDANCDRHRSASAWLFDPKKFNIDRDGWRRVSTRFLQMVLLNEPWRNSVDRRGIRILNAYFEEPIDLAHVELHRSLALYNCRIEAGLSLMDTTCRLISLQKSWLGGVLNLQRAKISQDLFVDDGASFKTIMAQGLELEGQMSLCGSDVEGTVNLQAAKIGESMFIRDTSLGQQLDAVFVCIGKSLDFRSASLASVDLTGATIGAELRMAGGKQRPCSFNHDADLKLRNAEAGAVQDSEQAWPKRIELDGFTYGRFGGLGAGAEVDVAARGSKWFIEWLSRDEPYTRQPYHQCAKVLSEMGHPEMAADVLYAGRVRERNELLRRRRPPIQRQSLRQRCKRVVYGLRSLRLRNHLRRSRVLDRGGRWIGLGLLQHIIGYGYGDRLLWRPLTWAALLVRSGVIVTYFAVSAPICGTGEIVCIGDQTFGWRLLFSLDMLLPIVELSREHTVVQAGLDGLAYAWFALQRLFGWILALFIVAGLTGLTR